MSIGGTTVGPLAEQVRDRVRAYRDAESHPNYNAALEALLDEAGVPPVEEMEASTE